MATNDLRGNSPAAGGVQRAVGFTLPTGTDYQLTNIRLRLNNYNTTTGGDVALLQIYRDSAKTSVDPLGATLESVLFNNPTSSSDTAATFTFTPTTSFTFLANTRYWLLVDATSGTFGWRGDNTANLVDNTNGGITPTGIATFEYYITSLDNGATYDFAGRTGPAQLNNGPFNSFDIETVVVPFEFEASLGLLGLGSLWLGRKYLKKKQQASYIASRSNPNQERP